MTVPISMRCGHNCWRARLRTRATLLETVRFICGHLFLIFVYFLSVVACLCMIVSEDFILGNIFRPGLTMTPCPVFVNLHVPLHVTGGEHNITIPCALSTMNLHINSSPSEFEHTFQRALPE